MSIETMKQKPVALETVYETIIHWDEGGGKRSRRELARRIVALYTTPPAAKPMTFAGLCLTEIRLPDGMTARFERGALVIERAEGAT